MGVEKYLYGQGCRYDFEVTGFTTYQKTFDNHDKTTIFQANHKYYGHSRYDWCLIQFDGDDYPENRICPSQILGFLEFHKGLPSPFLVEEMNYSPTHIRSNNLKDTSKYVVIHTTTCYVHPNVLIDEFVCKVTLGNPQTHIYVVSVDSIVDSLNVSQDWGGTGNNELFPHPYSE